MRVFISWSGDQSRQIALLLKDWLPSVIQALDPWVSSADIEKGDKWFTSISESLVNAGGMGIFCLTRDNLNAPWMAFEAGALAANDRARVATFLHDVKPDEVKPPLGLFQGTDATSREDVLRLLQTMNKKIGNPLQETRLEKSFNANWASFQDDLRKIKATPMKRAAEPDQKELLHNILATVRRIERDAFRPPGGTDSGAVADAGNPGITRGTGDSIRGGLLSLPLPKNEITAERLAAALRAFEGDHPSINSLATNSVQAEFAARLDRALNEMNDVQKTRFASLVKKSPKRKS